MRKITEKVCGAFMQRRRCSSGNTVSTGESLLLHGNEIARWTDGGRTLCVTLAGWNTPTTRERLNGLGRFRGWGFTQRAFVPYFVKDGEAPRQVSPDEWIVAETSAQPMEAAA